MIEEEIFNDHFWEIGLCSLLCTMCVYAFVDSGVKGNGKSFCKGANSEIRFSSLVPYQWHYWSLPLFCELIVNIKAPLGSQFLQYCAVGCLPWLVDSFDRSMFLLGQSVWLLYVSHALAVTVIFIHRTARSLYINFLLV